MRPHWETVNLQTLLDDHILDHAKFIKTQIKNDVFVQFNIAQKEKEIVDSSCDSQLQMTGWVTIDEVKGDRIRYIKNIQQIVTTLNQQAFYTNTMLT